MNPILLIADPDDARRARLRRACANLGMEYADAVDAFHAMAALGRADFNAVLVAEEKRLMTVRSMLALARKRHGDIPLFLLMTAGSSADALETALGNAVTFLPAEMTPDEVAFTIRSTLGGLGEDVPLDEEPAQAPPAGGAEGEEIPLDMDSPDGEGAHPPLPDFPEMPPMPEMPEMPPMPELVEMPEMPPMPELAEMPEMPPMPELPWMTAPAPSVSAPPQAIVGAAAPLDGLAPTPVPIAPAAQARAAAGFESPAETPVPIGAAPQVHVPVALESAAEPQRPVSFEQRAPVAAPAPADAAAPPEQPAPVEAAPPATPTPLLEGSLDDGTGSAVVVAVFTQNLTGRLVVRGGPAEGTVFYLHGQPVWAEETGGDAALLARLKGHGHVPAELAPPAVPQGQLLGALVQAGTIGNDVVQAVMLAVVRELLMAVCTARTGLYRFYEDHSFLDFTPLFTVNPLGLIVGARRQTITPDRLLAEGFELAQRYVVPGAGLRIAAPKLEHFTGKANLVDLVDGSHTLEEFCAKSGLGTLMGTLLVMVLADTRLAFLAREPLARDAAAVELQIDVDDDDPRGGEPELPEIDVLMDD